jgi:hypothetical protein
MICYCQVARYGYRCYIQVYQVSIAFVPISKVERIEPWFAASELWCECTLECRLINDPGVVASPMIAVSV